MLDDIGTQHDVVVVGDRIRQPGVEVVLDEDIETILDAECSFDIDAGDVVAECPQPLPE